MNKKLLIIPCLVLASCQNANSNSTNTGEKEIVPVVMLIGQSNASGTSWSSYLSNHFDQKTINQYRSGFDKVQIAHQCEGFSGNNTPDGEFVSVKLGQGYDQQHFGPEVGMAEYLTKNYGKNIYIIKWAYGGTGLATDWKSPSFSGGNNGWCYDGFVNFAKDSIKALSTKYRVEVKAFCWMQGEEDSVHDEYTKTYGKNKKNNAYPRNLWWKSPKKSHFQQISKEKCSNTNWNKAYSNEK